MILGACMLAVFLLMSRVQLPLLRRGMVGGGLYQFVDEIRFVEVGGCTCIGVFATANALGLRLRVAFLAAMAASLVNVALLMMDVRMHTYLDRIESIIADRYGGYLAVWMCAIMLLALGLLCARLAWRQALAQPCGGARQRDRK